MPLFALAAGKFKAKCAVHLKQFYGPLWHEDYVLSLRLKFNFISHPYIFSCLIKKNHFQKILMCIFVYATQIIIE